MTQKILNSEIFPEVFNSLAKRLAVGVTTRPTRPRHVLAAELRQRTCRPETILSSIADAATPGVECPLTSQKRCCPFGRAPASAFQWSRTDQTVSGNISDILRLPVSQPECRSDVTG